MISSASETIEREIRLTNLPYQRPNSGDSPDESPIRSWWGSTRTSATSRSCSRTTVSGQYHFTTYGYDPTRGPVGAFFVEAETETGAMVEYSFNTIGGIAGARAEYEAHLAGIARGVPIVQAVP
jgi:hypothetical protein